MNKFKLYGALLATSFALSTPTNVHAYVPDREKIEKDAIEEYNKKGSMEYGYYNYESTDPYKIDQVSLYDVEDSRYFTIGDFVLVNGTGSLSSTDDTSLTKEKNEEIAVIVGIKDESMYPYALAKVNDDLTPGAIIGWYKDVNIKKACVSYRRYKHQSVIKELARGIQCGFIPVENEDGTESWKPDIAFIDSGTYYNWNLVGINDGIIVYYYTPRKDYGENLVDVNYLDYDELNNGKFQIVECTYEDGSHDIFCRDNEKGIVYTHEHIDNLGMKQTELAKKYNIKSSLK